MKKVFTLCISFFYLGIGIAQTFNLELASPAPQIQDADVGSIAFGDIDNDGDKDLMATGKGGPIQSTLYLNDGNGNFSEKTGTPFVDVFDSKVGFEDVDKDGFLDMLLTGISSTGIATANLYMNNGTGNFSLASGTPFEPGSGGDFKFGDLDSDGDSDLIITGYDVAGMGYTKLYLNNGVGIFSEAVGVPFEALKSSSIAFIDLEKDDDLDVLLAGLDNSDALSTSLYINDGSGNFSLVANSPFENCANGDIAVADSDNDGDQDVILSGSTANSTSISNLYINDGTGSFSLASGTPFPSTVVGTTDFADFDNDGDFDVLIIGASPEGPVSNIYENQGSNNFVLANSLIGAYIASTAISDIDGDNDLDVIIAGTSVELPVRATKTYINNLSILPVRLTSFSAKISTEKSVQLLWETSSEENNDYFSIEHSSDGNNFLEIAKQSGHGTTSKTHKYTYVHNHLENGWHYYRLKQVDFDGRSEYSNILRLNLGKLEENILLMPNPTSGIISIQMETSLETNVNLDVLNTQGQVILSSFLQNGQKRFDLDLSYLPNGIYYLKLLKREDSIIKRIIKQE